MDALDNLHGSIYINIRQGVIVTDIHIGHSGVKQTTSDKNRLKHSIAIIKGTLFLLYYSTLITSGCFCFLYKSTKETIQIRYKKINKTTIYSTVKLLQNVLNIYNKHSLKDCRMLKNMFCLNISLFHKHTVGVGLKFWCIDRSLPL